ncbi:MAG: DUF4352 domain-containing protein [Clostridiales bacterium]|nr:DUF4352 domain-containing protein [Clostridiales bacterium]
MENKKKGKLKWLSIAIITILAMGIVGCTSESDDTPKKVGEVNKVDESKNDSKDDSKDDSDDSNDDTSEDKETESEEKNEFFAGDVVETKTLRISFLSVEDYISDNEFEQPAEGKKFIKASFEFENIGKDDEYVSDMDFDCYADGYSADMSYVLDNDLSATISKGMKAKGDVVFEVPVDAQEVVIQYETDAWTSSKINFYVVKQ